MPSDLFRRIAASHDALASQWRVIGTRSAVADFDVLYRQHVALSDIYRQLADVYEANETREKRKKNVRTAIRFLTSALVILLLFTFVVGLAVAQETTPDTPTPAAEVTPEPTPPPVPSNPPLISIDNGIGLLLLFGLSIAAGGGVLAIIYRFLDSKDVRDRVEEARESWSPDQREFLAKLTDGFERISDKLLDFMRAVQDGQPNVAALTGDTATLEYSYDFTIPEGASYREYSNPEGVGWRGWYEVGGRIVGFKTLGGEYVPFPTVTMD